MKLTWSCGMGGPRWSMVSARTRSVPTDDRRSNSDRAGAATFLACAARLVQVLEGHVPKLCESHRGCVGRNHERFAREVLEVAACRLVDRQRGREVGWQAGSDERLETTYWQQERASRVARLPLQPVHWRD